MLIGFTYLLDAYYVSNDKGMCSHFKLNTLENRTWCHSRRIEFSFDAEGNFSPSLKIESIGGEMNEASENRIAAKEVRSQRKKENPPEMLRAKQDDHPEKEEAIILVGKAEKGKANDGI